MGHYIDTIGLAIRVETGEPLAGATGIILKVRKPSGENVEWSGSIYGTSKIAYVTVSGDLDEDGWYRIYPSLTLGGWQGRGTPTRFLIEDPEKPDKKYRI